MTDITDLIAVDATTFKWPQISSFAPFRPIQFVIEGDPKPLDPDVKLQIEQAWNEWTTTCTSGVDDTDPMEDIKQMIEKVRAQKLNQMKRSFDCTLWYQLALQAEIAEMAHTRTHEAIKSSRIEFRAAVTEYRPKPLTPRERLRTMKAHPRSVRGRR